MCTAQCFDDGVFDTSSAEQALFDTPTSVTWSLGDTAPDALNGIRGTSSKLEHALVSKRALWSLYATWLSCIEGSRCVPSQGFCLARYQQHKRLATPHEHVRQVFEEQIEQVTGAARWRKRRVAPTAEAR
jgi:Adenosine-deaminase (editase) domain